MADSVVSARDEAQLGTGMLLRQVACLLVGHLPVVDAVQDQQRPVGELLHGIHRTVLLQLMVPRARRAGEVLGPDDTDEAANVMIAQHP